jgi:hypothetical protein
LAASSAAAALFLTSSSAAFSLSYSCDSGVPLALSILQRSSAIISLEVDMTARSKELLRDGLVPISCREDERRTHPSSEDRRDSELQ